MEAHRASVAEGVCQEDIIHPVDGVKTELGASVIPPPTEPNVTPSESEQPLSSSVTPSADAVERP